MSVSAGGDCWAMRADGCHEQAVHYRPSNACRPDHLHLLL